MDLRISRTYVLLYQRNSRYSVRTYGLFHTHMSAENISSNRFGNGVCHRSKQGKTIGFSAAAESRQILGSALPNPLGTRMLQSEYIYHGIPLYFERPTVFMLPVFCCFRRNHEKHTNQFHGLSCRKAADRKARQVLRLEAGRVSSAARPRLCRGRFRFRSSSGHSMTICFTF